VPVARKPTTNEPGPVVVVPTVLNTLILNALALCPLICTPGNVHPDGKVEPTAVYPQVMT
jgi:hypothetical protein